MRVCVEPAFGNIQHHCNIFICFQGMKFMQNNTDPILSTNYLSSGSCLTEDFFYIQEWNYI